MTLHTIQVSRSVKQVATVQVEVPERQTTDATSKIITDRACKGEFEHLWRDVGAFDVDAFNSALLFKYADDGAKKSVRFVPAVDLRESAMRIELLRNRYNHLTNPGNCDESEGIRSHEDMACILADMKHWCDFFKVDFSEVQRLSEARYREKYSEYQLEDYKKKQL